MSSTDAEGTEAVTESAQPSQAQPSSTQRLGHTVGRHAAETRARARLTIRQHPTVWRVYRAGIGVVGGGTVALGVILMPLPGPGTLIGLGGLALLATEFDGAKRVQNRAVATVRKAATTAKGAAGRRRSRKANPGDLDPASLHVADQSAPSAPPLSAK